MANDAVAVKKGMSRIFLIESGAGPTHVPEFLDWGMGGALEQAFGDITSIEVPSSLQYNQYEKVGEIQGAVENPTLPLTVQRKLAISRLLDLARRRCPFDVHVHTGLCEDPRDFDAGWQLIDVLEGVRGTTFSTEDVGSLTSGDEDKVTESLETSGRLLYQISHMSYAKRAESQVTSQVIAVNVCDKPNCGDCGAASDGCSIVFAVTDPAGSSPGLLPEVVYTSDGYTNAGQNTIVTFAIGENPDDAACVGTYYVVVSSDSLSHHVATKSDILADLNGWSEVASGYVTAKGPQAIVSISPRDTFVAGRGGYIYFMSDPLSGVTVLDAGVATVENLNDIDAFSVDAFVAVGDNNAVVYSLNGGSSVAAVTGPAAGVNLICVAMRSLSEWWVGTANGKLYYTTDSGLTWTQKGLPGSTLTSVDAIRWASNTVGFVLGNTSTTGKVFRTISGGNSWYVEPATASGQTMPTQKKLIAMDVCLQEVNHLYAGGQATGGVDGVLIKGSPLST